MFTTFYADRHFMALTETYMIGIICNKETAPTLITFFKFFTFNRNDVSTTNSLGCSDNVGDFSGKVMYVLLVMLTFSTFPAILLINYNPKMLYTNLRVSMHFCKIGILIKKIHLLRQTDQQNRWTVFHHRW